MDADVNFLVKNLDPRSTSITSIKKVIIMKKKSFNN